MDLSVEPYNDQKKRWPKAGRHILAQYDDETIIVYQSYRPSIGSYAVKHQRFGGEFRLNRMSWIKTNFLWMMYRSGWGVKTGQEVILGIRLKREFFDSLLAQAVLSKYDPDLHPDIQTWSKEVSESSVRLQWDPDRSPSGGRLERRAIQLGLRGSVLRQYAHSAIAEITDLSQFVESQRIHVRSKDYSKLVTPTERVYCPTAPTLVNNLKLLAIQFADHPASSEQ